MTCDLREKMTKNEKKFKLESANAEARYSAFEKMFSYVAKKGTAASQIFDDLAGLRQQMSEQGNTMSDDFFNEAVLRKLPAKYEQFPITWKMSGEGPSFKLRNALVLYEQNLQSLAAKKAETKKKTEKEPKTKPTAGQKSKGQDVGLAAVSGKTKTCGKGRGAAAGAGRGGGSSRGRGGKSQVKGVKMEAPTMQFSAYW